MPAQETSIITDNNKLNILFIARLRNYFYKTIIFRYRSVVNFKAEFGYGFKLLVRLNEA